jgi:cell division septum initiation protein DivIVA
MIFASEPSSQGPEKLLRFSPLLLCLALPLQSSVFHFDLLTQLHFKLEKVRHASGRDETESPRSCLGLRPTFFEISSRAVQTNNKILYNYSPQASRVIQQNGTGARSREEAQILRGTHTRTFNMDSRLCAKQRLRKDNASAGHGNSFADGKQGSCCGGV